MADGRTKYLEETMKPGVGKDVIVGVSKLGDMLGFKQEKEYSGKSTEELAKKPEPTKKADGGEIELAKAQKLPPAKPAKKDKTIYVKKGGAVKSASARADGCAQRGKTRGRMM